MIRWDKVHCWGWWQCFYSLQWAVIKRGTSFVQKTRTKKADVCFQIVACFCDMLTKSKGNIYCPLTVIILDTAPNKIAGLQPLTSHHINHPSKMNKTCSKHPDKQKRTPIHGHTSVNGPVKSFIRHLCADTGCRLEDLPGVMADRDGRWDRVKWICAISTTWW